jgi:hypothetical protein
VIAIWGQPLSAAAAVGAKHAANANQASDDLYGCMFINHHTTVLAGRLQTDMMMIR